MGKSGKGTRQKSTAGKLTGAVPAGTTGKIKRVSVAPTPSTAAATGKAEGVPAEVVSRSKERAARAAILQVFGLPPLLQEPPPYYSKVAEALTACEEIPEPRLFITDFVFDMWSLKKEWVMLLGLATTMWAASPDVMGWKLLVYYGCILLLCVDFITVDTTAMLKERIFYAWLKREVMVDFENLSHRSFQYLSAVILGVTAAYLTYSTLGWDLSRISMMLIGLWAIVSKVDENLQFEHRLISMSKLTEMEPVRAAMKASDGGWRRLEFVKERWLVAYYLDRLEKTWAILRPLRMRQKLNVARSLPGGFLYHRIDLVNFIHHEYDDAAFRKEMRCFTWWFLRAWWDVLLHISGFLLGNDMYPKMDEPGAVESVFGVVSDLAGDMLGDLVDV